jgi:1-aminocyclopropane-1-carboxylate deaminase
LKLDPRLQSLAQQLSPSPLQPIFDAEFASHGLELWIKRDDLLHPIISGNKWRKLKYCLNHALSLNADCIVSMGGAYSNHCHALAFAGKALGLKTVAYIRGEPPAIFNSTLRDLQDWGMELRFVSREAYRQLRQYKQHDSLPDLQAGQYWLPEGGASELALQGLGEIIDEIELDFDYLATACGTGTTLAGLINQAPATSQLLGVAAIKNGGYLIDEIQQLANRPADNWQLLLNYHHGGFAKSSPELLAFIEQFQQQHGIALEPIYTGKLLFAVYDLMRQAYFAKGQRLVVLHTGGLQGIR